MKRFVFASVKQNDIEDIWDYSFKEWGIGQAERYIEAIRDTCLALALSYKGGRTVDVRQGYMKCPTGQHMIYFLESSDRLEVVRILYGKQDVQWRLLH